MADHRDRDRDGGRDPRPRLKQIFGIFERLFELAWVAWVYVVAIELVKLSR